MCCPVSLPIRRATRCAYAALSALFLGVNVACAVLGQRGGGGSPGSPERAWRLVLVRVLVNDLLFLLEAVVLAAMLLLLTRHARPAGPCLHSRVGAGALGFRGVCVSGCGGLGQLGWVRVGVAVWVCVRVSSYY